MSEYYAFDIDGALNRDGGEEAFRHLAALEDVKVGVVSARSQEEAEDFVEKNNLKPDFVETGMFKGQILRDISDEGVYVGSWVRDRIHAKMAGWQYEPV